MENENMHFNIRSIFREILSDWRVRILSLRCISEGFPQIFENHAHAYKNYIFCRKIKPKSNIENHPVIFIHTRMRVGEWELMGQLQLQS